MINNEPALSPIVVVGLPRSGSTLTTAVLNESTKHYVLNDAYFLQKIDANNSWSSFSTPGHADALKTQLVDIVVRRSAVHGPKTIANSSRMSERALNEFLGALESPLGADNRWHEMMASVLNNAARAAGKTAWGWNTPQDIYHIERVVEAFPNARFICVMRNPFDVLRSFHHRPLETARKRYHPAAQAIAWRKAIDAYEKIKDKFPDKILLIRYEDLVQNTAEQIARINEFIGSDIPTGLKLTELGSNSSFKSNHKPEGQRSKNITEVEEWLADKFVSEVRTRYGYTESRKTFSINGLAYLSSQTAAFLGYYFSAALFNGDVRKRIIRFLR